MQKPTKQKTKSMEPRPEVKRTPRITPEAERVTRANAMVKEVALRYTERYQGEKELFPYALDAYRAFLTDFVPIPRPSYGEELMANNIEAWAGRMSMNFDRDARGNVAAVLQGHPDKVIVLQHHLDIVADMVEGSLVDPHVDSIVPEHLEGYKRDVRETEVEDLDNLWIRAQDGQTTLGADNGAGGAIIRIAAERLKQMKESSPHPENFPTIIVLGTVEEEAHLGGVKNLDLAPETMAILSKADFIINADMEMDNPKALAIEGAFGLESTIVEMKPEFEPVDTTMRLVQVDMSGFSGGHSGLHPNRQHAGVALLTQLEDVLGQPGKKMDWRLSTFLSGHADNQIAETAHALIAVPTTQVQQIEALVEKLGVASEKVQTSYKGDPAVVNSHLVQPGEDPIEILTDGATQRVFTLLSQLKDLQGTNGEFTFRGETLYSKAFNLGLVQLTPHEFHMETTTRIGEQEAFGYYPPLVGQAAGKAGANVIMKDPVKIWDPDETSLLPEWLKETYHSLQYDKGEFPDIAVEVVTAGLELGELHQRFPRSKNITLAMWIDRIHQPGERMQIPSFIQNAMLLMKFTDRLVGELTGESSTEDLLPSRRQQLAA